MINRFKLDLNLIDSDILNLKNKSRINAASKNIGFSNKQFSTPMLTNRQTTKSFVISTKENSDGIISQSRHRYPQNPSSKYNYCRQNRGKMNILARLKKYQDEKTIECYGQTDKLAQNKKDKEDCMDTSEEEITNINPFAYNCNQRQTDIKNADFWFNYNKSIKENSIYSMKSQKRIGEANIKLVEKNAQKWASIRKSRNISDTESYHTENNLILNQKYQLNSFNEIPHRVIDFTAKRDSKIVLNPSSKLLKAIIKDNKSRSEAIYSKIRKHSLK